VLNIFDRIYFYDVIQISLLLINS